MFPTDAVVLAAGMGSRLGPLTAAVPKPLVEVNGIPIARNALARLAAARVRRTIVVVGHLGEQIKAAVGASVGGMHVEYCLNSRYRSTGSAESLRLGLERVEKDVVVLEGDVFFDRSLLEHFLAEPYSDATLVERWRADIDGSVVELGSDAFVTRWVHRSQRVRGFRPEGTFKTVNVHRFSREFVNQHLRPAVTAACARDDEPLEAPLARAVAADARIRAVQARGRWVEIDDARDLRQAARMFRDNHESR